MKTQMQFISRLVAMGFVATLAMAQGQRTYASSNTDRPAAFQPAASATKHRTVEVQGLKIFYREAGERGSPVILLLHGFPTSSQMFRDLIPLLADRYHVIAPDYPGFGHSAMPAAEEFDYTFDRLTEVMQAFIEELELKQYTLYVMDYGAPIGFRIAAAAPKRVDALVVQNGNAYEEGLREFWDPIRAYWADPSQKNADALRAFFTVKTTEWQYTNGTANPATISPDTWITDQYFLDRPGNNDIQLALFLSYGSNPPLYPQWQEYFREHQPPTLIVWGRGDYIFPAEGAFPYLRDLPNAEFHLLNTGHFALEEEGPFIAERMRTLLHKVHGR